MPLAPIRAAGDPLRLLALGTSLTSAATWPEAVGRGLSECSGRRVLVDVVAQPGADVRWGFGAVAKVDGASPDIVLIEFATNDSDIIDGLFPARAQGLTQRLLGDLRARFPDARVVLMTMNPVSGLVRHLQRPLLGRHDAGYRALAAQDGVGLVDFAPRWASRPDLASDLPDGLHPEAATAEAVMLPVLLPYLGAALGVTCPRG